MPQLLVIDDDQDILNCFRYVFPEPRYQLQTAATAGEAMQAFRNRLPDAVISDIHLPDGSGLDLYRKLQALDGRVPIIFMTGVNMAHNAIEAMKLGAFEYLFKPLELPELTGAVDRALEIARLAKEADSAKTLPEVDSTEALLGNSAAMREVYKTIGRVVSQDVTVLIRGESGTGKEMVARAIYQYSRRAQGPFLAINCAAIPEALLESELFGHEKGSFTGADRKRAGKFEQCDGGTLFLDEIGDMSPLTQTKILRVLQDQHFERVGGNEPVRTNVRLLAATNCDLEKLMTEGRFRTDLFYRLNVVTIHLPPLRERVEDIPILCEHYVKRFSQELQKPLVQITPETMAVLKKYRWPGNIRELQSVVKQAILNSTGAVLLPCFLPSQFNAAPETAPAPPQELDWPYLDRFVRHRLVERTTNLYQELLDQVERRLFLKVLEETQGNQTQASRILGITRPTLRSRLTALNIGIERYPVVE